MRFDYIRSRNRVAMFFLVSTAVFSYALVMPQTADDSTLRLGILFSALGATLVSGVWLGVRWNEANRLLRLRSGTGVLAQWAIDTARWDEFRRRSSGWDKRENVQPNDVDFTQVPGDGGIRIIVARDGILVGEQFRPLEKDANITVHGDWVEFVQVVPKADGPLLRMVLRLPLEPGKEGLADEVRDVFQHRRQGRRSARGPILLLGLTILVGLPAVTAIIWYIARATGWLE